MDEDAFSQDVDDVIRRAIESGVIAMVAVATTAESSRATIALAARVPQERDPVLREVARRRIAWVVRSGWPLVPETVGFWNALVGRMGG